MGFQKDFSSTVLNFLLDVVSFLFFKEKGKGFSLFPVNDSMAYLAKANKKKMEKRKND